MTHYCAGCGWWRLLDPFTRLCGVCLTAWRARQAVGC